MKANPRHCAVLVKLLDAADTVDECSKILHILQEGMTVRIAVNEKDEVHSMDHSECFTHVMFSCVLDYSHMTALFFFWLGGVRIEQVFVSCFMLS
jgi:hypothetical protein